MLLDFFLPLSRVNTLLLEPTQLLLCFLELCPWTKTHGQHVQHVNPFFFLYISKTICVLASLQGDRASPPASAVLHLASPNTRSQQGRCQLRSLLHQERSKPHLPPQSPTILLGQCVEVAGASLLPSSPSFRESCSTSQQGNTRFSGSARKNKPSCLC